MTMVGTFREFFGEPEVTTVRVRLSAVCDGHVIDLGEYTEHQKDEYKPLITDSCLKLGNCTAELYEDDELLALVEHELVGTTIQKNTLAIASAPGTHDRLVLIKG